MDLAEQLRLERQRLGAPVDALSRIFFLFADPVDHVRAPVVWSALLQRNGINAVLLPAHTAPLDLDMAITGAKRLRNVDGLMFTMPFKVAAMKHAERLTPRAARAGSINLMRPEADGSWSGDNVDGAGFVAGLEHDGVALQGAHVYLHGCGGVGQSLAWTLAEMGIHSLTVFDLDRDRGSRLASDIHTSLGIECQFGTLNACRCSLAINASPVGLHAADPLPFDVDGLPSDAVVADVIMEPQMTRLLETAHSRGLKIHHGRHMMSHALPLAAAFYRLPPMLNWQIVAPIRD